MRFPQVSVLYDRNSMLKEVKGVHRRKYLMYTVYHAMNLLRLAAVFH